MLKWRLMLTTLPLVLGALGIKVMLRFGFGFEGLVDFSDVGVVLTGAVFLIGFMLAGTMADYKESEKLPGELACSMEALEEALLHATAARPAALDAARFQARVLYLASTVRMWLTHQKGQHDVMAALTDMQAAVFDVERAGSSSLAGRALGEVQSIRRVVTRIGVISRTGFLASGYALLDTLVVLSISTLFVARFKSAVGEIILVPFVTLIFVYMVRLIRDVDDPFSYGPDGSRGTAEVELTPIDDYMERVNARIAAVATTGTTTAAAPPARALTG